MVFRSLEKTIFLLVGSGNDRRPAWRRLRNSRQKRYGLYATWRRGWRFTRKSLFLIVTLEAKLIGGSSGTWSFYSRKYFSFRLPATRYQSQIFILYIHIVNNVMYGVLKFTLRLSKKISVFALSDFSPFLIFKEI